MRQTRTIGYWSAIGATVFAICYSIAQILSSLGIIPHPKDLFWLFLPSLFLAPCFLIATICMHYCASKTHKIWTGIAVSFAIQYATCICIVYFSQLTVVLPSLYSGSIDESHVLAFVRKSFLMAVDCLGYFFMSLSMFFGSWAFRPVPGKKMLFWSFLLTGSLLPVLVLAFFFPLYYYIGALWMILFPWAMLTAAKMFRTNLADHSSGEVLLKKSIITAQIN